MIDMSAKCQWRTFALAASKQGTTWCRARSRNVDDV